MNSYARTNDRRSAIWVEIKLTHLALWICLHDVIARVSARIMWLMFYARCGKSSTALCTWYPTDLFYAFSTVRVWRNVLVHSCEFQINLSEMFSIDTHIYIHLYISIYYIYKSIKYLKCFFFFFCIIPQSESYLIVKVDTLSHAVIFIAISFYNYMLKIIRILFE